MKGHTLLRVDGEASASLSLAVGAVNRLHGHRNAIAKVRPRPQETNHFTVRLRSTRKPNW